MLIFHHIDQFVSWRLSLDREKTVGFVPTMGCLHRGHVSLIEKSTEDNDYTVVSIFINQLQFDQESDFLHYPQTLKQDCAVLESCGVDALFVPNTQEIFPLGVGAFVVHVPQIIQDTKESQSRPSFFQGIATIILKLFNIVRPSHAYFGEKDYIQFLLIQYLVQEFFYPIHLILCPTIREESGLALSSRNQRLSLESKKKAQALFHALSTAASAKETQILLENQGFSVVYAEDRNGRRFASILIDGIRLADNVLLED